MKPEQGVCREPEIDVLVLAFLGKAGVNCRRCALGGEKALGMRKRDTQKKSWEARPGTRVLISFLRPPTIICSFSFFFLDCSHGRKEKISSCSLVCPICGYLFKIGGEKKKKVAFFGRLAFLELFSKYSFSELELRPAPKYFRVTVVLGCFFSRKAPAHRPNSHPLLLLIIDRVQKHCRTDPRRLSPSCHSDGWNCRRGGRVWSRPVSRTFLSLS